MGMNKERECKGAFGGVARSKWINEQLFYFRIKAEDWQ